MKKVFGVVCGVLICCNTLLGNDSLTVNESASETINDSIALEVNTDNTYQMLPLKEQILFYFETEQERTFYSNYMLDNDYITQGDIAKILCHYIDRTPIYLPEGELCKNPFIGRLLLECIWGDNTYDEMQIVRLNDWDLLFQKAKQFKTDEKYADKILDSSALNIKQKWSQYRTTINANGIYENVSLGDITKSNMQLVLDDQICTLYQVADTNYISLKTLQHIGFLEQKKNNVVALVWDSLNPKFDEVEAIKSQKVYFNNESIYIGELKTYTLKTAEDIFIPIRALLTYFDLKISAKQIVLNPKSQLVSEVIECDDLAIINKANSLLKINYTDLYWDGTKIIEQRFEGIDVIEDGKIIKNTQLYALRKGRYLTTIIDYLETDEYIIRTDHKFGQDITSLLTTYQHALQKTMNNAKEELFPASIIMGTMKYATNGLTKGQKVEVWLAQDGVSYQVKDSHNKMVKIPWNSISIPKDPKTAKDKPTQQQIEDFINSKNMSSQTMYLVWTDLYRQQTYVFQGRKNEWKLMKTLLCSTGKNITPTPRGTFELKSRVPYFGVNKGYRCKYAFQIFGDYLYHSIIFDVTGTRLLEGKGVLGNRASQGCIRFSEEDSLWFYNTMKPNTKVWIN